MKMAEADGGIPTLDGSVFADAPDFGTDPSAEVDGIHEAQSTEPSANGETEEPNKGDQTPPHDNGRCCLSSLPVSRHGDNGDGRGGGANMW